MRRIVRDFRKYIVSRYLKYCIEDKDERNEIRNKVARRFMEWLKENKEYLDLNEISKGLNELEKALIKQGDIAIIKSIGERNEYFKLAYMALLRILSEELKLMISSIAVVVCFGIL